MEREALKLALEALKEISRHAATSYEDEWCGELAEEAITAINALAQPEQEPVAWMSKDADIVYTSVQVDGCFQHDHIPLYTTLPQRPWVELTGNEWFEWWRVSQIANEMEAEIDFADFFIIAQAVVAKLRKITNETTT